jgi:energy-coupling factor transporter transmembrane protein EcfT
MSADSERLDPEVKSAMLVEYATLRDEILRRLDLRQQLLSLNLTIAAVFFGVGLGTRTVAFVFPPLAMLLAVAWSQNDFRIRKINLYIRTFIEPLIEGLGWESHSQSLREQGGLQAWRLVVMSHSGTFFFSQIIAIIIGLLDFTYTTGEWILVVIDMISVVIVILLMFVQAKTT